MQTEEKKLLIRAVQLLTAADGRMAKETCFCILSLATHGFLFLSLWVSLSKIFSFSPSLLHLAAASSHFYPPPTITCIEHTQYVVHCLFHHFSFLSSTEAPARYANEGNPIIACREAATTLTKFPFNLR